MNWRAVENALQHVMLSAAKYLREAVPTNGLPQMLRCAQHDMSMMLFHKM
jgi:hypothetical protein